VAVKKIFDPVITDELLEEMRNEVIMLSFLRHPNIVQLMGSCSKPPDLALVFEFVEHGSLYDVLHMSR
jgi:serine/threonine protein kinase